MSKTWIAVSVVCGMLLAGGVSFAIADTSGDGMAQEHGHDGRDFGWSQHGMSRGHWGHHGNPALHAAIADLRGIERLYLVEGRPKDAAAMYQSVLAKTTNPMLRDFAYHRLARVQLLPSNAEAAIGTLQKSLDEDLTRLNSDSKADTTDGT